jgi:hypothetical protein
MRFLEVGPALRDFTIRYSPNDNPAKCDALIGSSVRASPVITDDHTVVFGDLVLDLDVNIAEALISSATYCFAPAGPGAVPGGTSAP